MLGIVITHGRLGDELIKTATSILGPQESLEFISNEGHSHDDLVDVIEDHLRRRLVGDGPAVVFVDLAAGSCAHACRRVSRDHPEILLACGVNLPMLLEFLYHRSRVSREELRERLVARGRDGVDVKGWDND